MKHPRPSKQWGLRLTGVLMVATACGGTGGEATTTEAPPAATVPTTTIAATTTSTTMPITTTTMATTTTTVLGNLPDGDPVAGQVLFNTEMNVRFRDKCATCHTDERESEEWGPDLIGIGQAAGERVPDLSAEEYLQQSITSPRAYVLEGWSPHMPGTYATLLSDQQLADLIAFLLLQ